MKKLLLVTVVFLAACGGTSAPTTLTASSPTTTSTTTSTTTIGVPAEPGSTSTTTEATVVADPDVPELNARCGAVEIVILDEPVLPTEPLDDEAVAALEQAKQAVAAEWDLLEPYVWAIAERSQDRLVLFGVSDNEETPFADMVIVRTSDGWKPEGFGQCRLEPAAPQYGNAIWVLDAEPTGASTQLSILINERNCASGEAPIDREVLPVVEVDLDQVTITILVKPVSGAANCQSNPWHPVTIDIGEPLGDRTLFDGGVIPPQVQDWPPADADLDL